MGNEFDGLLKRYGRPSRRRRLSFLHEKDSDYAASTQILCDSGWTWNLSEYSFRAVWIDPDRELSFCYSSFQAAVSHLLVQYRMGLQALRLHYLKTAENETCEEENELSDESFSEGVSSEKSALQDEEGSSIDFEAGSPEFRLDGIPEESVGSPASLMSTSTDLMRFGREVDETIEDETMPADIFIPSDVPND